MRISKHSRYLLNRQKVIRKYSKYLYIVDALVTISVHACWIWWLKKNAVPSYHFHFKSFDYFQQFLF